jgi:hypothetical protein
MGDQPTPNEPLNGESVRLLPCPFCGREDSDDNPMQESALNVRPFRSPVDEIAYRVECVCGCQGASDFLIPNAIAAWNRRPSGGQDGGGEAIRPGSWTRSVEDYIAHYGSGCRGCADENGQCPTDQRSCDPVVNRAAYAHALKAIEYGVTHGYLALASPAKATGWPSREDVAKLLDLAAVVADLEYEGSKVGGAIRARDLRERREDAFDKADRILALFPRPEDEGAA